jgi:hypothetical protein
MKFRRKTWFAATALGLALTTVGGIALADDPLSWYEGGHHAVADPNRSAVALKLYDASGVAVTSGSTTTALAAYAAADGTVRAGDEYATLYVHLPQTSTAPGAWPGVQATGTDKFTGSGALTGPGSVAGKPFVRTTVGGDYKLADVIAALPNSETAASFAGVYELRLRTSSATAGVADSYAAGWIKVTGNTWAVTTAPELGEDGNPTPAAVGTTTAASWPGSLTYGQSASVSVTVTPASGSAKPSGTVRLVSGATTVAQGTLSAAGTATLSLGSLEPGTKSFKVTYAGVANAFTGSESSIQAITVGKATPGKPTFKATKVPTAKKKGKATVTVSTPAGLAAAGGTAQVVLTKGKTKKTLTVTIVNGTATVKLPKLPKGKWKVVVTYAGDAHYLTATSKSYKLKVKAK